MDPRVRELVTLSVLAALGCGLAAVQGDLLFVAIFDVACAVTIIANRGADAPSPDRPYVGASFSKRAPQGRG
jgi:hypothetical protein